MEITVVGHLCKDRILLPGETQPSAVQFGGIVYSVAALSAAARPDDVIRPVCSVGLKDLEEVTSLLKSFPNVDIEGLYPVQGPMNEVTLIYGAPGTPRIECSADIAEPIPFNRIKPFLDTNGILVNMVSGSDISLETLDHIRMTVRDKRIPIHFDFHSLTLGVGDHAKRFRRSLTDWRRWCFMLHSVQMSEEEAAGLSAERYDETTLINQLMPLMVQVLLVTRGERGVTLVTQDVHKHLTRHDLPGAPASTVDTTGCGDVFGATYFANVLNGANHHDAAVRANVVAALHSEIPPQGKPTALVERMRALDRAVAGTSL